MSSDNNLDTSTVNPVTLLHLDKGELLNTTRKLLAKSNAFTSRVVAVNEIGVAMNDTLEVDEILRHFSRRVKWVMDFQHCSVCLSDEQGMMQIHTMFGADESYIPEEILKSENIGVVLRSGHAKTIIKITDGMILADYGSQMIIPLHAGGNIMGTINFATISSTHMYNNDDLRIAYLLSLQLAAAIRNARQFEELARTRAELENYAVQLETRNQELDAYAHTIAHDLKSPLNAILLKASLIKRIHGAEVPGMIKHLDSMTEISQKMEDMIGQLLWLAKLRDVSEHMTAVDMQKVATAAAARFEAECEQKQITITIDENLPLAHGQAQWLEEILANFISNAIKYRKPDETKHTIRVSSQTGKNEGMLRFSVIDNGIGIPEDRQAELFEMFTRLHAVTVEGLGLGLSIVHRMANKMGGDVGVESKPGEGSTFYFHVPVASEEPQETETLDAGPEPEVEETIPEPEPVTLSLDTKTKAPIPTSSPDDAAEDSILADTVPGSL